MGHISTTHCTIWATIWATLRAEVGVSIWVPFTSTGPFSPFPVMLALCSGIVLSFRVIFLPCPASLVMFSLAPAIFSLFPTSVSLFSCYFPLFPNYVRANFPPSLFIFSSWPLHVLAISRHSLATFSPIPAIVALFPAISALVSCCVPVLSRYSRR